MEWSIIAVLAMVVLILVALYSKAVSENNKLSNYALLILLDDKVHASQRAGLTEFVRACEAKNARELGGKANLATVQLASRLSGTVLGVAGLLWKLKNGGSP